MKRFLMAVLLKSLCCQTDCWVTERSALLSPQTGQKMKEEFIERRQLEMPWQQHAVGKKSSTSVLNLKTIPLLAWPSIMVIYSRQEWYWLFSPAPFFLQRGSVTWQWTPMDRWRCPCPTPTPGRQPWTTWGCLPSGSVDSNSCQVQLYPNFTKKEPTSAFFYQQRHCSVIIEFLNVAFIDTYFYSFHFIREMLGLFYCTFVFFQMYIDGLKEIQWRKCIKNLSCCFKSLVVLPLE